jgi:hypothetical protein
VLGLKERPSSATRLPFRVCSSRWSLLMTRLRCLSLTATAASRSTGTYSYSPATARRAATSLGKHEPPQPIPADKKREPIRSSRPMPCATLRTSALTSSQRLAISLIKLTLVARKALAAYLIISALARSVVTNGTATLGLGSSSVGKLCSIIGA